MSYNSPLEQFKVYNLILDFSNVSLFLIGIILPIVLLLNSTFLLSNKLIPNNSWIVILEGINSSIENLVLNQIGKTSSETYYKSESFIPVIYTLFVWIFISNVIGLIPYSLTVTSQLILCFSLSVSIWIGVTIIGLIENKQKFFSLFIPNGTPLILVPLLVLIELVSYFARALSLGIRLGANMISGHVLLNIISNGSLNFSKFIILLPLIFLMLLMTLELGITFLQSYVFVILTCTYIRDSIYTH